MVSVLACQSAAGRFWNLRTSPYVISGRFFAARSRVGPSCSRSTACSDLALPIVAALSRRNAVGQAGQRCPMAPAGLSPVWRWRSRSGRPPVDRRIRDLIRQMSSANPLWGCTGNPRRAAQARHRDQPSYGRQVHGGKTRDAFLRPGAAACAITPKALLRSICSWWRPHRFSYSAGWSFSATIAGRSCALPSPSIRPQLSSRAS